MAGMEHVTAGELLKLTKNISFIPEPLIEFQLNIAANVSRRLHQLRDQLNLGVPELASNTCMAGMEHVTAGGIN
ncbi:hypothetical protein ACP70R_022714 [Stipagrostis hirtigluma subsp. patula]